MTYLSRRSIPTADRISDLPDSILCHILSFIPTKLAATTSVLSKRWKLVWLSVLALYFDQEAFKDFHSFRKFVYLTMFSLRDKKIPINSFTFKGGNSSRLRQRDFDRIFKFLIQRGVENLNFDMSNKCHSIKLPPRILNFKTLHVLKLGNVLMRDFDKVDFPCVKTLVLDEVYFTYPEHVVKFLLGCPILEDLNTKEFVLKSSLVQLDNLNVLPNLVNVRIRYYSHIPLTLVCKAKSLRVKKLLKSFTMLPVPVFHNLTHMELNIHDEFHKCIWLLGRLPSFPKLQHLIIKDCGYAENNCDCWKHPPSVPECLSSQLKTCCIRRYKGTKREFEFAKYIMQHSKVLETMKIQSTCIEKEQMLLKLSSCTRASTTCKLLFD